MPDTTILFKSHVQSKPNQDRVLGGHVHWRGALEATFGEQFKTLSKVVATFGAALGSAARIFSSLVSAGDDVLEKWLRHSTIYFPSSYGA